MVALLVVLGGLAACSTSQGTATSTPADPMAPTGPAATLAADTDVAGTRVAIGDLASMILPADAQVGEPTAGANGTTTVVIRFSATDSYPAMQVSWQDRAASGAVEQSWTMANALSAQPSVSGYTRSTATWPKAAAAVATSWDEELSSAAGGTRRLRGTGLWLQSSSGAVLYAFIAVPAASSTDAGPLSALQSLSLD
jgi:hypothetical protein